MESRWNLADLFEDLGRKIAVDCSIDGLARRLRSTEVSLPNPGQRLQIMYEGLALGEFELASELLVASFGNRIGFQSCHPVHAQKVF